MSDNPSDLDRPLRGAEAIGREAKIFDKDGNVVLSKVYYGLGNGYIDADKYGRLWISTPRRIRRGFVGEPTTS